MNLAIQKSREMVSCCVHSVSAFAASCKGRARQVNATSAFMLLLMTFGSVFSSPIARASATSDVAAPSASVGVIIPIHGEINSVMVDMVRTRIDQALAAKVKAIVFDLNTPAGTVSESIAIADMIREVKDIRTVAWVNPNAHSGGAIVALACSEIVMARSSRLGNTPGVLSMPLGVDAVPKELRPKAYSQVLAELRASANLRGYSTALCEALVVPDREVWWVENITTGQREFVDGDEYSRRVGKPRSIFDEKPATEEASVPQWKPVESYHDVVLDREVKISQPINRADQNLEMNAGEAVAFGFAKAIASNESELRSQLSLSEVVRLNITWSESLAGWLTSIYVRGFLLVVVLLGIYIEFHAPGVSLPGFIALVALVIFVAAPYVTGLANVWEIIVIFVGLMLVAVEIFILPGFGVAGISGIALVLIGILGTFIPNEPGRDFPFYIPAYQRGQDALKLGIITVSSSLAASVAGMFVLSRFLPKIPVFNRLIPMNPTPSQVQVDDPYRGAAHVGDMGESVGPLRPAGKARFGGLVVDVVSQGAFIEGDTIVEVVERRGNRVVVRPRG